jgi:hypothetical protein
LLKSVELQIFSTCESKNSTWGTNDDVRAKLVVLEELNIIINWHTAVKSGTSNLRKIFCESIELLLDLIGELSGIAQDEGSSWLWVSLVDLVQDRKDEDSGLTHTGLSLAQDIFSVDSGWDALLLDLGRMLVSALGDCSRKFTLEEEVSEGGSMNTCVGSHPIKMVLALFIQTYLFPAVLDSPGAFPLRPPSPNSSFSSYGGTIFS